MVAKQSKKSSFLNKPLAMLVVLLLVLGVVAGAAYLHYHRKPTPSTPTPTTTYNAPGTEKVDLNPPTQSDKQAVDQHKADLGNQKNGSTSPSTASVTPAIVDASQYDQQIEVRAFIPNIYESGGTCTISFSKDSAKFSKQVAAVQDATTTRCTNLTVPRSEFSSAGNWSVTVAYTSSAHSGSSAPKTFTVN